MKRVGRAVGLEPMNMGPHSVMPINARSSIRRLGQIDLRKVSLAQTGWFNAPVYGLPDYRTAGLLDCPAGRLAGPAGQPDWPTEKYFVVCANYLGGCYGTTGPNSIDNKTGLEYGENFPNISFKDIEISQKQLIDDLGVKSLKAVIGPSIGGLMALEFALLYPDFVENLISISSGYKLSTIQLLHNLEQAYVLNLAKDSPDRRDEYLSLARMIAHKTYISLELLASRAKGESKYGEDIINGFLSTSQESYMMHQGEKFIQRFTHESYNSIIKGWQNFSIDLEQIERLKDIKVLIVSVDSDVCFYPEEQAEFIKLLNANNINSTHKTLSSTKGHDCFLLEPELFEKELGKFI